MKLNANKLLNISPVVLVIIGDLIISALCANKDYYQLLGVSRDATDKQIKKAFRKLAIQYHPDKNKEKDAEDRFREIAKAYEVLSDKEKRKNYDQFGDEDANGFGNGFGGFNSGGQAFNFNFNDFFKNFDESMNFHQSQHTFNGNHEHNSEHFNNHFKAHFNDHRQHAHKGFGFNFDDIFDDMDKDEFGSFGNIFAQHSGGGLGLGGMFGDGNSFFGSHFGGGLQMNAFSESQNDRCRTVTKRVGNSVMTYTECS